jgi:hypothetical protein
VRPDRVLRFAASERGSTSVESVLATVLLLLLTLGAMEVAFALYGRNVLISSAHEGARAAIELGRHPSDAAAVAERTVRSSAGGLVDRLEVQVSVAEDGDRSLVVVRVSGLVEPWGPVPLPVPVSARATASREDIP